MLRAVTLAWCPDSRRVVTTDTTGPRWRSVALHDSPSTPAKKRPLTRAGRGRDHDSDPRSVARRRWLVFRRDVAVHRRVVSSATGTRPGDHGRSCASDTDAARRLQPSALSPDSREIVFLARDFSGGSTSWRPETSRGDSRSSATAGLPPCPRERRPGEPSAPRLRAQRHRHQHLADRDAVPRLPTTTQPIAVGPSTSRDDIAHASAHGRRVTFTSSRTGDAESGWPTTRRRQCGAVHLDGCESWVLTLVTDGQAIAFYSQSRGQWDVFVVPSGGGRPRNATTNPDGCLPQFLARRPVDYFGSTRRGETRIWRWRRPAADAVKVSPAWVFWRLRSSTAAPCSTSPLRPIVQGR